MKNLDQDDNDPLNAADLLRFGPLPIRKKKAREEALKILSDNGWIKIRKLKNSRYIVMHPLTREL